MGNLKIGTFNVRGLRDTKKLRKIFKHLHQRQFDIVMLQETHSEVTDEKYWKSLWGGNIYYSHGSRESRGVMIMIKKNAPVVVKSNLSDLQGRLAVVNIMYEERNISIVNLYAPNKDSPEFFLEVFEKISTTGEENKEFIIGGDFNLVLNIDLDKVGGRRETHEKSAQIIKAFMEDQEIVDIWRFFYPERQGATYYKKNPESIYSRLDFILVSASISGNVTAAEIAPTFMSDHDIPWINITPSENSQRGRGFWRFNTLLLKEKEYIEEIKKLINEIKVEKMDGVAKWEWLKHRIKRTSIEYSKMKSKSSINKLLIYEKKLKQYNEELIALEDDKTNVNIVFDRENILRQKQKIESDREAEIDKKVQGSVLRARQNWHLYGEKSSAYYFRLENANYKRKNRFKIKTEEGIEIKGVKNVLKEQDKYYSKLYKKDRHTECTEEKFNEYVKNLQSPKISEVDKENLEVQIEYNELRKAIFSSKSGKVPGNDGIPIEFYQTFFEELGGLLLEVCRRAAHEGLHSTACQSVTSLIEKLSKNMDYLKHWRPLSLLNVDGKVYMKILALRMEKVLPKIVHPDQ